MCATLNQRRPEFRRARQGSGSGISVDIAALREVEHVGLAISAATELNTTPAVRVLLLRTRFLRLTSRCHSRPLPDCGRATVRISACWRVVARIMGAETFAAPRSPAVPGEG